MGTNIVDSIEIKWRNGMKVCDIVLNSIWFDPRVRKQIAEYQANGINVVCVGLKCPRYNSEQISLIPCKTNLVSIDSFYDGKQNSIWKKIKREKLRFFKLRDAILVEKPDIIHANDLNALIPAYSAAKKLKCCLIYDSHEINTENYFQKKKTFLSKIMRCIEKYIVKRVDKMVCVSHSAANYFSKTYKVNKPMVVTNCVLKKELFDFSIIQKHKGFEVLNHGQFYEGRGYDIMAETLSLIADYKDIHLVVRGFGRLEKLLHEKVDSHSNCDQFKFYPPVLVQNLIFEAAKSNVGIAITIPICLNFKLSVSNKIFEYAAAGLPVIMSDIPEHRYLNERYQIGVVLEENTPECLFEAIKKLYRDKLFYKKCVAGAQKMTEEINWENEFGKLIEFERKMLSCTR